MMSSKIEYLNWQTQNLKIDIIPKVCDNINMEKIKNLFRKSLSMHNYNIGVENLDIFIIMANMCSINGELMQELVAGEIDSLFAREAAIEKCMNDLLTDPTHKGILYRKILELK